MLEVRCNRCQARLKLGDEWAGKKGKCPRCNTVLHIPAPAASSSKPAHSAADVAPLPPSAPTPRKPVPLPSAEPAPPPVAMPSVVPRRRHSLGGALPHARSRMIRWFPWLAAGGVVVLIGLGGLMLTRSGKESDNDSPPVAAAPRREPPATREVTTQAQETAPVGQALPAEKEKTSESPLPPSPPPPPSDHSPRAATKSVDAATFPDRPTGGLTGESRRYDDMHCQQIQLRHGVRIPPSATIVEIDGLRLPITQPMHLARSAAAVVFLTRGIHAVRFREREFPVEVAVRSDIAVEYEAMRKYFNVSGPVHSRELINRSARVMDVHAAPFLLNFMGAWHAAEKQWDVAEREFRRALCVNPAFSPAHLNLATCLLRRGARPEAVREVELADVFNVENVFGLAPAVAEMRRTLKMPLGPSDPIPGESVSYVTTETPTEEDLRMTALLEGISKYAVRESERVKILNNLAVHFSDRGRPELALYHFRHALAAARFAGPERFVLARKIFNNMSNVCRKAGFPEAEMYRQMGNMITP
ncbi:MAG: hypothetical protein JXB10_04140 [Pirellulales bacterium]|nr:hypothetical protein [Pirellulales bacterium]